jgi:hypothetical protein
MDYGEQIFEDPDSYELIGVTPAAKWHVRVCGLNADHLTHERRRRAEGCALLKNRVVRVKGDNSTVRDLIAKYRQEVQLMIPEIPVPRGI